MKTYYAADYAYGLAAGTSPSIITTGCAAGGSSIVVASGVQYKPDGTPYSPFATTAPITVGFITSGTAQDQETITPSAVTLNGANAATISYSTFTYAHGTGGQVMSGTCGLQEAINDANTNGGGVVVIDSVWVALGGTQAMILAATYPSKVQLRDARGNGAYLDLPRITLSGSTDALLATLDAYYVVGTAGVDAMTLAAPASAASGKTIIVTSTTANAHTITATSLLNNGGAGVPYTTATFAAKAGASITLVAENQKWNVLNSINVTLS